MLVFDIFELPFRVKGMPLYKAVKLAASAGQAVGQFAGEQTAARIKTKGAATDRDWETLTCLILII